MSRGKISIRALVGLLALSLLVGCGSDDALTSSLSGRSFLLGTAEGFQPVSGTTVRLRFDRESLSVSAGCNTHGGRFEVEDGRLIVKELASTEVGCDAPRHAQDEWLADFFTARPRLTLREDELTVEGATARLVFVDREVADPDRALAETPWEVDTFITGGAASNFPLEAMPTLLFRTDGSLTIDTTCNTGAGRYGVRDDQLTLTGVTFTDRACSGASRTADAHLQAVLRDGTLSLAIEARRLTLQRGDVGIGALAP